MNKQKELAPLTAPVAKSPLAKKPMDITGIYAMTAKKVMKGLRR